MKFLSMLSLAIIATGLSSAAFADIETGSQSFQATNKTDINVNWQVDVEFDRSAGHQTETATSAEVYVSNTGQVGSQAVIDNNCRNVDGSTYKNTYKCTLVPVANEGNNSVCSINGSFLIQDAYEGSGSHTECTQTLAIVMHDGSWLVDPYHKDDPNSEVTHNFQFSMLR